jgi:hypothetical protein
VNNNSDRIAVTSVLIKFFHFVSSWVHTVLFFAKLLTYNSQIRIKSTELCLMKALSSE